MTHRLAVIQPRRCADLVANTLEPSAAALFENWRKRLDGRLPEYDPALHRRVLTAYVEYLCGLLCRAGELGCHLVLLPEGTLPVGNPYPAGRQNLVQACQEAEPLWLERTAPIARKYGMLIASCYYRVEEGRLYNDGVLMDERGEVAGIYHKVHLPCGLDWELTEAGLFTAGNEYPVFQTKVGRVGFQICYDIDFPEGCRCLALNGAQVILHPTVGYAFPDEEEVVAEARLRTRATDNSVVVAYANFGPSPGRSAIYTANGNQAACCGRGVDQIAFADVDVEGPRVQVWPSCTHDHREHLLRKRRPDTYGVLVETRPPALARGDEPAAHPLYEYPQEVGLP
ncbi:MAG: carbon-nitrogen hydrolase family protein [Armatimonadota bacterium]|nr:carbon-nitrogen hydrolase family protein [Armatimonadota bacterium]